MHKRIWLVSGVAATPNVGWRAGSGCAWDLVSCGQLVAGTIKLAHDLPCVETDGLVVRSHDTIIDLKGQRITCSGAGRSRTPGSLCRRSPCVPVARGLAGLAGRGGFHGQRHPPRATRS